MNAHTRPIDGLKWLTERRARPSWYILIAKPQQENAAVEFLKKNDIHAFYPKQKLQRKLKSKTVEIIKPHVSGYIAARIGANPNWYQIFKRGERLIADSIKASDGFPMPLPKGKIQEFERVAMRYDEITKALEEYEQIRVGHEVVVVDGPMVDQVGKVGKIHKGAAQLDGLAFPIWVRLPLLRRL